MERGRRSIQVSHVVVVAGHHIAVRDLVAHAISWLAGIEVPVRVLLGQPRQAGGAPAAVLLEATAGSLAQEGRSSVLIGRGRGHLEDRLLKVECAA